ncbi:MAG: cytochrome c maturation protein CcmE [Armatimonadota bacterium]|nr:cytochrome c maturation protein CcmE [Armatimonadota bacterium]MDR7452353.1 cytochrome c maturation protein CcmE [Armatimonadota bacterium]MDR7466913.1 cytochrome c maturation protein CcmE [Armatimonadota bacterium]MDR7493545.1 cytochrome c maturation protein CcmE [Armatimonadota bacterium]MDR7498810.1 cytochrome c maturation protein CcmE [Armatimonadota bacterium]
MTASRRLVAGLALIVLAIAVVAYSGIRSAAVYYLTPTEFAGRPDLRHAQVRLAGRVELGSVRRRDGRIEAFTIGDGATTIEVRYDGPLPDLFAEGREVLVEGRLDGTVLAASRVMTTHPTEYREAPPR